MAEHAEEPVEKAPAAAKPPRRRRGWPWIVLAVLLALLALFVVSIPTIVTSVNYPEFVFDLTEKLTNAPPGFVSNTTARVKIDLSRRPDGAYFLIAHGKLLDWPFTASVEAHLAWRFLGVDAEGGGTFHFDGSDLCLKANFKASLPGGWSAEIELPPSDLDETEPLVASLLSRVKMPGVSDLKFSGALSLKATAEQTREVPVPVWNATGRLQKLNLSLNANGNPVAISNLRSSFGASGVAQHVDIKPLFPRADSIESAGFTLTNVFASVRATETALLVTEAGANFCGGMLKVYSFFLDPAKLNAGVTLFIDGIDAGETLRHVKGFSGEASGKLHGKLPLYLRNGKELSLRESYLYSVPGEVGTLKLYDPNPVLDNLALGGVSIETRDNFAKALANLDYTVLKLSLRPEEAERMALGIKLEGSATRGEVTVPVSFEVTFHGDLEQLINTGLKAATRKKP